MSQPGEDGGRRQSMDAGRANSAAIQRKVRRQAPQKTIEEFWASFSTKYPGKVLNILPKNSFAQRKAAREPKGTVYAQGALRSYDDARAECIAAVQQLARECRRVNMRYRDAHFDIEFDLKTRSRRCLDGIMGYDPNDSPRPRAVKRIPVGWQSTGIDHRTNQGRKFSKRQASMSTMRPRPTSARAKPAIATFLPRWARSAISRG